MEIKIINQPEIWENFFNICGSPSFHHSWEWGELQKSLNNPIIRLGVFNSSQQLVAIALVVKLIIRRGSFLFIPHGPTWLPKLTKADQHRVLSTLIDYLKKLAKEEKFWFIRIAPVIKDTAENRKLFRYFGFFQAPIYLHAERVWLLNILPNEDEILAKMRKTTRYLIKKAQKDGGLVVQRSDDNKVIDDFWSIYEATYTREHFIPFSRQFISKEYQSFAETGKAVFLFGKAPDITNHHGSKTKSNYQAAALILFTQSTAFYHQGASFHSKFPITYLLQWEAIKEAKKRGCRLYNFYGIYKAGRTPKNWQGLTLFKMGFGGYQFDYLPTQDLIISPKYYLSYFYEKFLNWKRKV